MESATNIFDSLSVNRSPEVKEKSRSRDEVKESTAASQFYSLFSGNLAKSYQSNQKTGPSETEATKAVNESSEPVKREEVAPAEKGFLENSPNDDQEKRLDSARESRKSRAEARNSDSEKNRISEKEEFNKTESAKEKPAERAIEKEQELKAETKVIDYRARATKTVEGSGKKITSESTVQINDLKELKKAAINQAEVKGTQKTQQQTDVKVVPETKVSKNVEMLLDSKSVKSQAAAKADSASLNTKADAATAVQPGNEAASSNSENSSGNQGGANTQVIPSTDSFAAKVAKLTGKSFTEVMQEAKGISAKNGANGPQLSPGSATINYNRRAGEVTFTTKANGTVKTTPSQIINQVVKAAKVSVNSGTQEMKLLLKPEELGWLKVKITMADGKMTAHFGVENEAVKSLLEGNLNQLQQALNGQNLKVAQITIDVNVQSNPESGLHKGDNGKGNSRRNFMNSDADDEALEEALQGIEAQLIELSAVNVMI